MRFSFLNFVLGPVVFLFFHIANASVSSYGIHHLYTGIRSIGMGDAFVGVASDYSSLFYNPAGLARRTDGELNLSLELGVTNSVLEFSKDIKNASNESQTDEEKISATASVLEKYYGKGLGFRANLFEMVLVRPGWGIGFLPMNLQATLTVNKEVGPGVNALVYGDSSLTYGYGTDVDWLNSGRLSFGFTGKFVNRLYANLPVTLLELAFDKELVKSSALQEGYTIDGDVGFLLNPVFDEDGYFDVFNTYRPSFGLVIRNIAESGFNNTLKLVQKEKEGRIPPEKLYRVIDIGTKWELPQFWIFGGRLAMDVRDIMHPSFNSRKAFHAGLEFDWMLASWWRGQYRVGINQGYPTLGLSALFTIFNLDIATYGEDVGTYNHPIEKSSHNAQNEYEFLKFD